MSLFGKPKNLSKPNELGYQFGIAEDLTEYAHREQNNWGNILPSIKITVYEIWKDDHRDGWMLIDEETGSPLKDYTDYESCAVGIDQYKVAAKLK